MQPSDAVSSDEIPGFNPHPARRPDATRGMMSTLCPRPRFNPHPARRPDATGTRRSRDSDSVSFNPHPARRPDATRQAFGLIEALAVFQSSSGQKAGCNTSLRVALVNDAPCFNPHPARRPDATASGTSRWLPKRVFQSSSGQKAGCNRYLVASAAVMMLFQSSSGQKAGCNRLYLNFLSVLREPPDTALPICFHCPDHSLPPATIQLRTRTSKLQWLRHWVRVRPPAVP